MSIGSNIKKRRYELRMSQQELANLMGYKTRSTIAKIESGENDVTHSKLSRFAQALDTTVEALITGRENLAVPSAADLSHSESPVSGSRRRTAAVILAGGKLIRNQQNIPNQFINILGKPVIVYCLEAYQSHPAVDDIYIVCLRGWEQIVTAYAKQYGITKLRGLLPGAASGILSVKSGLDSIREKYRGDDIIIFQESTRPLVNADMISRLLQACYENGSANLCQSMKDYLQFTLHGRSASYVDRAAAVEVQSPEAYHFDFINAVFAKAESTHHSLSESCCVMLMYNLGYPINFIEGSATNNKILRQEDITIVTSLIQNRK